VACGAGGLHLPFWALPTPVRSNTKSPVTAISRSTSMRAKQTNSFATTTGSWALCFSSVSSVSLRILQAPYLHWIEAYTSDQLRSRVECTRVLIPICGLLLMSQTLCLLFPIRGPPALRSLSSARISLRCRCYVPRHFHGCCLQQATPAHVWRSVLCEFLKRYKPFPAPPRLLTSAAPAASALLGARLGSGSAAGGSGCQGGLVREAHRPAKLNNGASLAHPLRHWA
jgi:hypothetical protein